MIVFRGGGTTKDSISALREQTTLANTRLHGVLRRTAAQPKRMMRIFQPLPALLTASFATLGCAGAAPTPDTGVEPDRTQPQVARELPRVPATTPVRASFEYAPGSVTYVVTTEATIAESDSVGSEPRGFREVARIDVRIVPVNGTALVTTTGSVEGATSVGMIRPFTDTLSVGGTDTIAEPTLPICGRDTVPPMHLVTLLPPVPPELSDGVRWQRRLVYGICQGPIPIRVERTDTYIVTGPAAQVAGSAISVTRSSSFTYSGSGVDGQHNVRVTGAGSGRATLILDTAAGRLVSAVEESVSEIDVAASGRARRFSQGITRWIQLPGSER